MLSGGKTMRKAHFKSPASIFITFYARIYTRIRTSCSEHTTCTVRTTEQTLAPRLALSVWNSPPNHVNNIADRPCFLRSCWRWDILLIETRGINRIVSVPVKSDGRQKLWIFFFLSRSNDTRCEKWDEFSEEKISRLRSCPVDLTTPLCRGETKPTLLTSNLLPTRVEGAWSHRTYIRF